MGKERVVVRCPKLDFLKFKHGGGTHGQRVNCNKNLVFTQFIIMRTCYIVPVLCSKIAMVVLLVS